MHVDKQTMRVLSVLCILIIPGISMGQVKNDKKLSPIPPSMRERFVERLNLYYELKSTKQYAKLYDLLSEQYSGVTGERPRREGFIRAYQELDAEGRDAVPLKWRLKKVIKELDDSGNGAYFIFLDVKVRYKGEKIDDKGYFEARVENGDWYFREYYVET